MTIQLSNRSIEQPLVVLEYVLIQINELIFPTDFYVVDMEDEASGRESPLILGRPFLMTTRTKIDVHAGTLSMEFDDTLVQFNIFEAMKHPTEDHSLFGIDMIEELVEEYFQLDNYSEEVEDFARIAESSSCSKADYDEVQEFPDSEGCYGDDADLAFETKITKLLNQVYNPNNSECTNNTEEEAEVMTVYLVLNAVHIGRPYSNLQTKEKSSPPPPLELKTLPKHLKNAYMDDEQILMEEDIKPIRQQQRRLNPTILDVVKKEMTKLLVAGIIYPISDS
ncbi:hypothetical protein CR513_55624, partial [Mucuna pruriens]